MSNRKTGAALVAAAFAAVCGCVSLLGAETREGRVVYLEDFDYYADSVACFRPGTRCVEWATGSLKGLGFTPEADGLARDGYFPICESPKGKWTLTFLVRNKAKEPSAFSLLLYSGDRRNPEVAEYPFTASKNYFQTCHVYSNGRNDLVGWNLKGRTGANIIIDRVRVEQGVHRPYRLGDPAEWLAEAKPFAVESLPADFGEAIEERKAYPVDFEKEDLLFKFKPTGADRLFFGTGGKAGCPIEFKLANDTFTAPDGVQTVLTNECLKIGPARVDHFPRIYTRSRLNGRYQSPEMAEILASLDCFPRPADKVFDLRFTLNERDEHELWVNGNFALFFTNAPVTTVTGSPAFRMKRVPRATASLVQKLDFRAWPDGFPLWRVRENRGGCWVGIMDYCCRSCFEAMPSSCLFSVPNRPYVKAKALCRVATDVPADFEPVVVARLTSYFKRSFGDAGGRNAHACCKSEIRLPRPGSSDPLPAGVERKGENLYEVTFGLDVGRMQDLLYREDALVGNRWNRHHPKIDQLDFEFSGVLWQQDTYYVDRSSVPDSEAQSSVVVLSGELEAAPCDFDVVPFQTFNSYLPDETPGGRYLIKPRLPGKYEIAWTVSDDSGRMLERGVVNADKGGIRFKTHEVGLYRVRYSFRDDGQELWHHDASYVVVPRDDRQAGYSSPYFSWLWLGNHGTCDDIEKTMDGFRRMGIKGTMLEKPANIAETNELCRKYGIYQSQFNFSHHRVRPPADPAKLEEAIERQAKANAESIARYPHTKRAMIFHESGGGPFPMELVGGKTELTEQELQQDKAFTDMAIATARAWRKADPSVKLVMGNSVESYGLLARVFRSGIPHDLVDFVGEETVGMSAPPEENSARVPWMQREIARIFGYDVKSDCPFEWKARAPRNFVDSAYTGTAFHIRDLLIAHALGYTLIPSGGLPGGSSDGYAQSVWSGSPEGRWPLAYPGRGTLASAVLTSVLDCAKFLRLVPTGSLGVFCEEFGVKGRYVYAFWTTRGETDVTLDLGANSDYETVSILGQRVTGVKDGLLVVSEEPRYLITAKPLARVTAALQRRYPRESVASVRQAVAVPLSSADEVVVSDFCDRRFFRADNPFQRMAPFAATTASDPHKGACVELKDLSGTEKTLKPVENCTCLKFPQARPVAGDYDTIGIWVEGNMGGGKVWFEFEDAEGEVWATTGSGGYGCKSYDWPNLMSVNFDGWHFLAFPLTGSSPVKVPSVGQNQWQLTRDGNGNGRIDFPVKVAGMAFSNRPWNLDFLEMRPTRPYVRLKEIALLKHKE